MMRPKPIIPFLEISAMTALLLSFIWLWNGTFHGDFILLLIIYFGLGIWTHLRRGESVKSIGIRLDNWRPASRLAAWIITPLAAAALIAGTILRSNQYPSLVMSIGGLAWGLLWGTAQQYGLLCFFYRRFIELLPHERTAMLAAGSLFAIFHLPNPFLAPFSLLAGILSCWIYSKEPNLPVMGAAHAILSFVVSHSLPIEFTFNMHVGP